MGGVLDGHQNLNFILGWGAKRNILRHSHLPFGHFDPFYMASNKFRGTVRACNLVLHIFARTPNLHLVPISF